MFKRHRAGRPIEPTTAVPGPTDIRTVPRSRAQTREDLRAQVQQGRDLDALDLERADLRECYLRGLDFAHLSLVEARLTRADLTDARLVATDLSYAQLREADLRGADLRAANLLEADLGQADLRGADLSSARHLVSAVLRKARFDRSTRWPPGYDPDGAGARRTRQD
jgi:uncharacterized protein YjbI with pentapeptide repeats